MIRCPRCGITIITLVPLTLAQRRMYGWCRRYEKRRSLFPSHADIARGLKLKSLATVSETLAWLLKKRWAVRVRRWSATLGAVVSSLTLHHGPAPRIAR